MDLKEKIAQDQKQGYSSAILIPGLQGVSGYSGVSGHQGLSGYSGYGGNYKEPEVDVFRDAIKNAIIAEEENMKVGCA